MITAIDTHSPIHYGPQKELVHNYLTEIMQEGDFYSAYPDFLRQISESAKIGKVLASPFNGVLDSARIEAANEDMDRIVSDHNFLYQWVIIRFL